MPLAGRIGPCTVAAGTDALDNGATAALAGATLTTAAATTVPMEEANTASAIPTRCSGA